MIDDVPSATAGVDDIPSSSHQQSEIEYTPEQLENLEVLNKFMERFPDAFVPSKLEKGAYESSFISLPRPESIAKRSVPDYDLRKKLEAEYRELKRIFSKDMSLEGGEVMWLSFMEGRRDRATWSKDGIRFNPTFIQPFSSFTEKTQINITRLVKYLDEFGSIYNSSIELEKQEPKKDLETIFQEVLGE